MTDSQRARGTGWALDGRQRVRRTLATTILVAAAAAPLAVGLSDATAGPVQADEPAILAVDAAPEILDAVVVVRGG